jgi:sRNA-binding protein
MPSAAGKLRKHRRENRRRRARRLELYQPIYDTFPECFVPHGDLRPPLAIGIREMLIEALPEIPPDLIAKALAAYTASPSLYRASFRFGEARIGLTGEPVGFVSIVEAEHAGRLLMEAGLVPEALAIARSLPAEERVA